MSKNENNLADRFSLLFTLPKSTKLLFLLYSVSILTALGLYMINSSTILRPDDYISFYTIIILQLLVVRMLASNETMYATIRRILAANLFVYIILDIFLLLLAFLQPVKIYNLLALCITTGTSLILIIYYGAFFNSMLKSLTMAFFAFIPFFYLLLGSGINLLTFSLIVTTLMVTILLLKYLDHISIKILGEKTTSIFKKFMHAWVSEYAIPLEEFLEKRSTIHKVKTYGLYFDGQGFNAILLVPYIHPGPFKPVGSYNLPYELKKRFESLGFKNVIVTHAPISHDFNLASHKELYKYLASLTLPNARKLKIKLKNFETNQSKNYEFTSIIGDKTIIIIISPKVPTEDFPTTFLSQVERLKNLVSKKVVLIDAHNNLGDEPTSTMVDEVVNFLKQLSFSDKGYKEKIDVGFYLGTVQSTLDIGPGGFSTISMKINKGSMSLVVFDANNAKNGLVEDLRNRLGHLNSFILLTSDSHFNAAKITNKKGYFALGDVTPVETLTNLIEVSIKDSYSKMYRCKTELWEWESKVKVIGEETLELLRDATNMSIKGFKRLWFAFFTYLLFSALFLLLLM
jgi:putative membrane protein